MASAHAGIAHRPHGQTAIEYLPLEQVEVKAWVVDVSSRIVLTQTFRNPSDAPTGKAKYVFPLPATAAVCAFRLELEDGSVVIGEIKDKEEAERTFSVAQTQGQTAALVAWVTDDIFTISVGSIPAATTVTAHLAFVMDLLDEGARDHIRLQLPMHIAERYGTPPVAMQDASAADSRTRVHINVDIQTSGEIYTIHSSTHQIERRRYKGRSGRKTQRRMSAYWKSPKFLESDFVITIHAEGIDKPRCFAEVLDDGREGSTVAMQLTLVPKILAPKVPSQEYIFIIDRSGSMSNAPIETAKQTLTMLLRLLPSTQTTFNIFSFGSTVSGLWQSSRGLDRTTLVEATSHVESMSANFGGTEIPDALQTAFRSRGLDRPAVVFLLTDGQVNPNDQLNPFAVISNAVLSSPPHAPVRLFVLGIGTGVSSDVCSRLAQQGNGEYLYAHSAENISGKCARLLNAGRAKNIERIDIDWGLGSSSPPVSLTPSNGLILPPSVPALAPPPPVQQAPDSLTKIFSGIRFTVFALISSSTVPTSVKLMTKVEGDAQEWNVEVTKIKPFPDEYSAVPMVHTLAARKLIMALDDGTGPLPTPAAGDALVTSEDDLRKAGIIRLGLAYQLVSRHTSFVAVRKGDERTQMRRRRSTAWARSRLQRTSRIIIDDDEKPRPTAEPPTFLDGLIDGVFSFIASIFGFTGGSTGSTHTNSHSPSLHRPQFPGGYDDSDDSSTSARGQGRGRRPTAGPPRSRSPSRDSTATFSTLSSFGGSECSACWTPSRSPSPVPLPPADPNLTSRPPSPTFRVDRTLHPAPTTSALRPSAQISQQVHQLALEMALDGSFTATPLLRGLVDAAVLAHASTAGVDVHVWTTAVAVAYMRRHLEEHEPDLLALVLDKAREFADAQGAGAARFDELVRQAAALLNP